MSEWWTYSLSDFLLFSPRTYYRLFELYNADVWPAQMPALMLGFISLAALSGVRARVIPAMLGALWLWVAWAYLLTHYDTINWAAKYFAAAFAIEAVLLLVTALLPDRFALHAGVFRPVGRILFAFALIVQPLIGPLVLERPWTQIEMFGVTPDPTVVATLGALVAAQRPHWELIVIPLLWCAVSGATLWTMQSPDWMILPAAGGLALLLTAWKTWAP